MKKEKLDKKIDMSNSNELSSVFNELSDLNQRNRNKNIKKE